ncbi:HAD family hydrolase [bacterium]|nr:HAD family hydrolase [bacterium]
MINIVNRNWTLENIDTVLFDKDGTFIDLHYFWGKMTEMRSNEVIKYFSLDNSIFPVLCKTLGYDIESKKMLSDGITALYSRSKIIEIFKKNLENFNVYTDDKNIEKIFDNVSIDFYRDIQEYTIPIKEAIEFIKELRKLGVKIGIVTSDSVVSTELTIKNFHWESLFDVVIGRESSDFTKESGVPTKLALEAINSSPDKTIMIGDAPMDYISAQNADISKVILVSTGQVAYNDLAQISPFVVKSLEDVKCFKS